MRVEVPGQQAERSIHVVEQPAALADEIASAHMAGPASPAAGDAAPWVEETQNSSIYRFRSHGDAQEAVLLLTRNGFDALDFSLVGASMHDERRPLGIQWKGRGIRSRHSERTAWRGVSGVLFAPATILLRGVDVFAFLVRLASEHAGVGKVAGSRAADLRMPRTLGGVPRKRTFKHDSARKSDPHVLMMHGSFVDTGRAQRLLVDHYNATIEDCLRFRQ
jgi:hypothetical protein